MSDWDVFLTDMVVFQTATLGPDSSGDSGARTLSVGTPLSASVQAVDPSETVVHGGVESVGSHRVYLGAEPIDVSTGARVEGKPSDRRCRARDLFVWTPDPANPARTLILAALGPAVDAAGAHLGWRVACRLRV